MGTLMGEAPHRGVRPLYEGIAPMSVGERAEEALLERFCEFFDAFKRCRVMLTERHTPTRWCEALIEALRALSAASTPEARALRQDVESDLYRALKRGAPETRRLTPRAVRALIEDGVGRQRVVIGAGRDAVRFYPLDQAYGVTARVVCLLNLSEGAFPQRRRPDRQDPTLISPLPNDLDLTREQLSNALSSLLAARDQVHIFYCGQKSAGEERAPAPFVVALQDEIRGRYQVGDEVGDRLIEAMTTRHPLHSFSARNFMGDASGAPTDETISHDPLWLSGALEWRASMSDPQPRPAFAGRGLDVAARGSNVTRLDTLRQLLKNPSEFFLKRGVGMHSPPG